MKFYIISPLGNIANLEVISFILMIFSVLCAVFFIDVMANECEERGWLSGYDIMKHIKLLVLTITLCLGCYCCFRFSRLLCNDKYVVNENEKKVTTITSFAEDTNSRGVLTYTDFEYNDPFYEDPSLNIDEFHKTLNNYKDHLYKSADDTAYVASCIQDRKGSILFVPISIKSYTFKVYLPEEYYDKITSRNVVNLE